jgi:hypothetical protein
MRPTRNGAAFIFNLAGGRVTPGVGSRNVIPARDGAGAVRPMALTLFVC